MSSSEEEEKTNKKLKKSAKKAKKQKTKDKKRQELEEENVEEVVVAETLERSAKATEEENEFPQDAEQDDADNDDGEGTAGTKTKRKRKRKRKAGGDDEDEENKEVATTPQDGTDMTSNTVFVEGIPFDASVEDVRSFFLQKLQDADILELRLPTWQDTGRLRGFGHVRLATKESYEKALALNRQYMGKRYLSVQPAKDAGRAANNRSSSLSLPPPEGCLTLFVNNLPYNATETHISAAFSSRISGGVTEDHVRIARNSVTRQSKGFCYLDFDTVKDLEAIVKASQQRPILVVGRAVRLDYDTNGRIKGSFRTDSGRLWTKEQTEKKREQHGSRHRK
jgi:nucleolin